MEDYYYSRMNKEQRSAYHAMREGFSELKAGFSIPKMEMGELSDIFFKLRLDRPEIFYVKGFSCRFHPGASSMELIAEYLFNKKKIREHQGAIAARTAKLIRPAASMSQLEKEAYIHNFICQNVRYDKLKKPYSHEIIGPLTQGVGVCEGIAKAVKLLCDSLGIACFIAVSGTNPEKGIKYRHAWNVVKVNGSHYHLDATFDNSLSGDGVIRYDYFNLDDRRIFRDHEPLLYPLPACGDGKRFYYREKKLSFTKGEEVAERARQALRKGKALVFHWRGGELTREVLREVAALLEQAAVQKGRHARIRLNWPQAVLQVSFPEEAPGEEYVAQVANEAEQGEDLKQSPQGAESVCSS